MQVLVKYTTGMNNSGQPQNYMYPRLSVDLPKSTIHKMYRLFTYTFQLTSQGSLGQPHNSEYKPTQVYPLFTPKVLRKADLYRCIRPPRMLCCMHGYAQHMYTYHSVLILRTHMHTRALFDYIRLYTKL